MTVRLKNLKPMTMKEEHDGGEDEDQHDNGEDEECGGVDDEEGLINDKHEEYVDDEAED